MVKSRQELPLRRYSFLAGVGLVGLSLAACGASPGSTGAAITGHPWVLSKQYAGQTITVLLPPWGQMPASQLAKFTAKTGIKVRMENLAWDSIHDKVVTAEAAGTAPADVTEVDWSWVGQFSQAGWYTNLSSLIQPSVLKDNIVAKVFHVNGEQVALPYNMDFRATMINWTDFKKAGITTVPSTWQQLLADAKQIKAKGVVRYPIGVPLSVTEGASTPWYELIKSAGGELFGAHWRPLFTSANSPGAQALAFEKTLYQDHLVPPGEVSLTDVQTETLFENNTVAVVLSDSPGSLPTVTNPSVSAIAKAGDQVKFIPFPGNDGQAPGITFGLPEGLGIPKNASNKGAAAMFINWWEQTPQLVVSYENANMGNLPPENYAFNLLSREGKIVGGSEIGKMLPTVRPLFPQGTPVWYPQFSSDVAAMIQNVVQGRAQPLPALHQLASQVQSMSGG
ncbi:MAG: extracellular solute-binding protein [Firmicutes bacterium]|jgi:multiple sugar transport system substrate-binding protein|nr:extracellular solute-binding protein [Bacillota bacterium]